MDQITELEFFTASENRTPTSRSVALDYALFCIRGGRSRWRLHRVARRAIECVQPGDAVRCAGVSGDPPDSGRLERSWRGPCRVRESNIAGGARNSAGGSAAFTGNGIGCPASERAGYAPAARASRNADRHLSATRRERLREQPPRRADAAGDERTPGGLPRRPAQP
jgi:hypothetical protein